MLLLTEPYLETTSLVILQVVLWLGQKLTLTETLGSIKTPNMSFCLSSFPIVYGITIMYGITRCMLTWSLLELSNANCDLLFRLLKIITASKVLKLVQDTAAVQLIFANYFHI